MSWFKSLVGGGANGSLADRDGPPTASSQPDRSGGPVINAELAELKSKFFDLELLDSADKTVEMKPLLSSFCQLFSESEPRDTIRLFGKAALRSFAFQISRCFVKEIKSRAGNQSTESASTLLANFLSNPDGFGFLAVKTLNLLVRCGSEALEPIREQTVPSTLVKALYLFFDLPAPASAEVKVVWDRMTGRIRVLLIRLLEHSICVEELVQSGDLARLFDMLISECLARNRQWQAVTTQVLLSTARTGHSMATIQYVHKRGLLPRCLAALQSSRQWSNTAIVDVIVIVVTWVKESSSVSHVLLDNFRTCHGYSFITDFVVTLGMQWGSAEADRAFFETIIRAISELTYCGTVDIRPSLQQASHPYQSAKFSVPQPQGGGQSVRNIMAFFVLHSVMLKSKNDALCAVVLDAVTAVFDRDPANYFITEPQHSVAKFLERIDSLSRQLQLQVLKLLEHVVCSLAFVPLPELNVLLMKLKDASPEVSILVLETLTKFVHFDGKYANVYRDIGLLDALVAKLTEYSTTSHSSSVSDRVDEADGTSNIATFKGDPVEFTTMMECIVMVLAHNPTNIEVFKSNGGVTATFELVKSDLHRDAALKVVQQLVLVGTDNGYNESLETLLEIMRSAVPLARKIKIDVLRACVRLFSLDSSVKTRFANAQGFDYVMSALISAGTDPDTGDETSPVVLFGPGSGAKWEDERHELVWVIFEAITAALQGSRANQKYFRMHDKFQMLIESLKVSGLMVGGDALFVCHCMITMGCGGFTKELDLSRERKDEPLPVLVNPAVVPTVIKLLKLTVHKSAEQIEVLRILRLLATLESNAHLMGQLETVREVLDFVRHTDVESTVYASAIDLVKTIASYTISPRELRSLLRVGKDRAAKLPQTSLQDLLAVPVIPLDNLAVMVDIAADHGVNLSAPFIEFNMAFEGHGSLFIPAVGRSPTSSRETVGSGGSTDGTLRVWPYTEGMTIMMWIRVVDFGASSDSAGKPPPVRLISLFSPGEPIDLFGLSIDPRDLTLVVKTPGGTVRCPHTIFASGRWIHLGFVSSKPVSGKVRVTKASVYLNGVLVDELPIPPMAPAVAARQSTASMAGKLVCARVGTNYRDRSPSAQVWRLGPLLLLSEASASDAIKIHHQLSPAYTGMMQGQLAQFQPSWSSVVAMGPHSLQRGQSFAESDPALPALTSPDEIDLRRVSIPVVPLSSIVCSISAQPTTEVEIEVCLQALGGSAASKLLSSEVRNADPLQPLDSLRNAARSGPLYAHLCEIGTRCFTPSDLARALDQVGGIAVPLKTVADATTPAYLRTAIDFFVHVVRNCSRNAREAEKVNGYTILGGLLAHKSSILSKPVFELLLGLVSDDKLITTRDSSDVGFGTVRHRAGGAAKTRGRLEVELLSAGRITNAPAFRELLLSYDVWRLAPAGLARLPFAHVVRLLQGAGRSQNIATLRQLRIVSTYLAVLAEDGTPASVAAEIITTLKSIFSHGIKRSDIQALSHFLLTTLDDGIPAVDGNGVPSQLARARCMILGLVLWLLRPPSTFTSTSTTTVDLPKLIERELGVNFFLQFLGKDVDPRTTGLVVQVIGVLLQTSPRFAKKFARLRGYEMLAYLLPEHCEVEEVLLNSMCIAIGRPPVAVGPQCRCVSENVIGPLLSDCNASAAAIDAAPILFALLQALNERSSFDELSASPAQEVLSSSINKTSSAHMPAASHPRPLNPFSTDVGPAVPPRTDVGPAVPPRTDVGPVLPPRTDVGPALPPRTDVGPALPPRTDVGPAVPPRIIPGNPFKNLGNARTPFDGKIPSNPLSPPGNPFEVKPNKPDSSFCGEEASPNISTIKSVNAALLENPFDTSSVPSRTPPPRPPKNLAGMLPENTAPLPPFVAGSSEPTYERMTHPTLVAGNIADGTSAEFATAGDNIVLQTGRADGKLSSSDLASTLVEFLEHLYHVQGSFKHFCAQPTGVTAMTLGLFPRQDGVGACAKGYQLRGAKRLVELIQTSVFETMCSYTTEVGRATFSSILTSCPNRSPELIQWVYTVVLQPICVNLVQAGVLGQPVPARKISASMTAMASWLCVGPGPDVVLLDCATKLGMLLRQMVDTVADRLYKSVTTNPELLKAALELSEALCKVIVQLWHSVSGNIDAEIDRTAKLTLELSALIFGPAVPVTWFLPCFVRMLVRVTTAAVHLSDGGGVFAPTLTLLKQLWDHIIRLQPDVVKMLSRGALNTTFMQRGSSASPVEIPASDLLVSLSGLQPVLEETTARSWTDHEARVTRARADADAEHVQKALYKKVSNEPGAASGAGVQKRSQMAVAIVTAESMASKSGSAVKSEGSSGDTRSPSSRIEDRLKLIQVNMSRARTNEAERSRLRLHRLIDLRRYISTEWARMDSDLHRETGVFGPDSAMPLSKYSLDVIEGPNRLRTKMVLDMSFYKRYRPAGEMPLTSHQTRKNKPPPTSQDSARWCAAEAGEELVGCSHWHWHKPFMMWEGRLEAIEPPGSPLRSVPSSEVSEKNNFFTGERNTPDETNSNGPENSSHEAALDDPAQVEADVDELVLRLLEPSDKKLWELEASRVMGLDAMSGMLVFCQRAVYFAEGYGISESGKFRRLGQQGLDGRGSDDKKCGELSSGSNDNGSGVIKWALDDIRDIRRRRYCLRDVALELFSSDGYNSLLAFESLDARNRVYDKILSSAPGLASSAEESVDGMQRDAKLEREGLLANLVGNRTVKQRWEVGELTNFEYLMQLNTLAGRSYNDLNQYPVFPWVLRDYSSETLDLNDPSSYRDLTKPMGAQTPKRAKSFQDRYEMWEDPTGEGQPAFHYGTHYSSAQYVAGYLVRIEPFATHFVKLQDGTFDHADRMFYSVKGAWESASELSQADVKELTPEFFYLPDFLRNQNKFDLGKRQGGEGIDDVELPPWAKGDPAEFIRLHRAALESDYVSSHLHHWIDLIFGFKQRGAEAEQALNVFQHLTYEGAVDIDAIEDPRQRLATVSIINNFGQTPRQLFKRPHPPRRYKGSSGTKTDDQIIAATNRPERLLSSAHPVKEVPGPVGELVPGEKGTVQVMLDKQTLVAPGSPQSLSWECPSGSIGLSGPVVGLTNAGPVHEAPHAGGRITSASVINARTVVTAGSDTTVRVWTIIGDDSGGSKRTPPTGTGAGSGERRTVLGGLTGAIGSGVGSGSARDNALTTISSTAVVVGNSSGTEVSSTLPWHLRHQRTLCGHEAAVSVLAICPSYSLLVSGSDDGTCIFWDLTRLNFVRQLPRHSGPVVAIATSSQTGDVISCSRDIVALWSLNGEPLAEARAQSAGAISACAVSELPWWSGDSLVATGHSDGCIKLWQVVVFSVANKGTVRRLMPVCELTANVGMPSDRGLTRLAFSQDHRRLYSGNNVGQAHVWSIPDSSGRSTAHWTKDAHVTGCSSCNVRFSLSERKHHCRNCGKIYCGKCSSYEAAIPALGVIKPVRVCTACHDVLQKQMER